MPFRANTFSEVAYTEILKIKGKGMKKKNLHKSYPNMGPC